MKARTVFFILGFLSVSIGLYTIEVRRDGLGFAIFPSISTHNHSFSNESLKRNVVPPQSPVIAPPKLNPDNSRRFVQQPEFIAAQMKVANKTLNLLPDSLGLYPQVEVKAKSELSIQLTVKPGETIRAQAEDGGEIVRAMPLTGDADGHVHILYRVGETPGNFRLGIYTQTSHQFLNFWVPISASHKI